MKHHPYFRDLLSGDSTRIAYGGRTLNEGGLQSLPQLHFPGGALIGCSAGMVNVAKIKGTHNAMKSGMPAAEAAYEALSAQDADAAAPADMSAYASAFRASWAHADLWEVRNVRPSFNTPLGMWGGIAYSGVDTLLLRGRTPWTFRNTHKLSDAAHTKRARECAPIAYPPFEPPLSTDLLTSLALTGTKVNDGLQIRKFIKNRISWEIIVLRLHLCYRCGSHNPQASYNRPPETSIMSVVAFSGSCTRISSRRCQVDYSRISHEAGDATERAL